MFAPGYCYNYYDGNNEELGSNMSPPGTLNNYWFVLCVHACRGLRMKHHCVLGKLSHMAHTPLASPLSTINQQSINRCVADYDGEDTPPATGSSDYFGGHAVVSDGSFLIQTNGRSGAKDTALMYLNYIKIRRGINSQLTRTTACRGSIMTGYYSGLSALNPVAGQTKTCCRYV